jgi:UDP-N-acetylmuramate dehydrogenase
VARVEENVPLARYTTIGTGGPARWFTRPATIEQLQDALRWAKEGDVPVETIGLGSNVLAHDDGIEALVVKLDGDLVAA